MSRKKQKIKRRIILVSILFLLIWVGFINTYSINNYINLRTQKYKLEEKNAAIKKEIEDLKTKIHRLKTDSTYLEKVFREEYGFHKKGEIIIRF